MDLFKMFSISGAGMAAQRSRMSVVAGNLANTETTRTAEGGPYRRRDVIFKAVSVGEDFSEPVSASTEETPTALVTVEVAVIKQSNRAPRKVFDPHHPDANGEGYVSFPDINVMEEMVDMLSAVRSYEANMTVYNTTKSLIRRLLEMGRTP
jgi:flagellar basal-body rod protein FlgC